MTISIVALFASYFFVLVCGYLFGVFLADCRSAGRISKTWQAVQEFKIEIEKQLDRGFLCWGERSFLVSERDSGEKNGES